MRYDANDVCLERALVTCLKARAHGDYLPNIAELADLSGRRDIVSKETGMCLEARGHAESDAQQCLWCDFKRPGVASRVPG